MTGSPVELATFVSEGTLYSSATPVRRRGQGSPLDRILHCDLITFIAIAQSVDADFVDIEWHSGLGSAGEGASANIQQSLSNASTNVAFKEITRGRNASDMYKIALSEILILQHPMIRAAENIIDLYGVGWDVRKTEGTDEHGIFPVLVYKNATQYGNLHSFIWNSRPKIHNVTGEYPRLSPRVECFQRLRLCIDIGTAIQIMHTCSKCIALWYLV